ncbi:hypothetical protein TcasGA2_TC031663 [Tribolium castaneum]|uniref:Uncharacterized protein n=1 Tax=Tribolium castaneum TaxID=7070 RepID=A0A139W9E1_TRICA|nr:hypothetical protein TcasGA2_TC031663 [Tribolium castaneum]
MQNAKRCKGGAEKERDHKKRRMQEEAKKYKTLNEIFKSNSSQNKVEVEVAVPSCSAVLSCSAVPSCSAPASNDTKDIDVQVEEGEEIVGGDSVFSDLTSDLLSEAAMKRTVVDAGLVVFVRILRIQC